MAKLTNPQVLSVWLLACSSRADLLSDQTAASANAGIDLTNPDVRHALNFLGANTDQLGQAQSLFGDMIEALGYDPPHCPPSGQLQGLSALAPE